MLRCHRWTNDQVYGVNIASFRNLLRILGYLVLVVSHGYRKIGESFHYFGQHAKKNRTELGILYTQDLNYEQFKNRNYFLIESATTCCNPEFQGEIF